MRLTGDFERHTEVNLDDWDVFHSRCLLVHLPRPSAHDVLIMANTLSTLSNDKVKMTHQVLMENIYL